MITDNKILTRLYHIINVQSIKDVIDGKVYKGEKPVDSIKQDIVLQCLVNNASNNDRLQKGFLNINCYCIGTSLQTRPTTKLNEITNQVLDVLDLNNGIRNIKTFTYKIESINTMRSDLDSKMFFTNIKLKFTYKN